VQHHATLQAVEFRLKHHILVTDDHRGSQTALSLAEYSTSFVKIKVSTFVPLINQFTSYKVFE